MVLKKQLSTCMFRVAATLVIAGLALTMVGIAAPIQLTIDYHTSLAQDIANFVKIYYPDIELKFVDKPSGSISAMTMRQ